MRGKDTLISKILLSSNSLKLLLKMMTVLLEPLTTLLEYLDNSYLTTVGKAVDRMPVPTSTRAGRLPHVEYALTHRNSLILPIMYSISLDAYTFITSYTVINQDTNIYC